MIFKKNFKSDPFENYKSFVPVEVQSHQYLDTHKSDILWRISAALCRDMIAAI